MKENPLALFDKILENLANTENGMATFRMVCEDIFPEVKIKDEDLDKNVGRAFLNHRKPLLIAEAMSFLREEKLVQYNENVVDFKEGRRPSDINVAITQKGLIKIRTNGFKKEYERSVWNYRIERFNKLVTPLIAFCAFLIALYNLFNAKKKAFVN
jgi:hypothetical protein